MKTLVFPLLFLAAIVGCTPNAQVVTLRGSNVNPDKEGLVLDNDTLTLHYSFASQRGQMHITIYNKLNQPLYIDWKRSSLIIGRNKFDYWYDVTDVNLTGSSYGSRYSQYTVSRLNGVISRESQTGYMPPQTQLEKRQFILIPKGSLLVSGAPKIESEPSHMASTQKKPVTVHMYSYSPDQSPFQFRNYLTLSTDKDFKTEFHIDTNFWISDIKVLPMDQLLYRFNGRTFVPIPFKKPDSFYIISSSH